MYRDLLYLSFGVSMHSLESFALIKSGILMEYPAIGSVSQVLRGKFGNIRS